MCPDLAQRWEVLGVIRVRSVRGFTGLGFSALGGFRGMRVRSFGVFRGFEI